MTFQGWSLASALALQVIGSVALPGVSRAAWPSDPNVNVPICTSENDQQHPAIVSDGVGGVIVTWQDRRSGNWDVYAQRVSAAGVPLWAIDGVALCTAANDQIFPKIVSDGTGGAIVAWMDDRNGNWDVFAQRVSAAGVPAWINNGVPVCATAVARLFPELAGDGLGGAIIVWEEADPWNLLHAQRISAAGVPLWGGDGVVLSIGTPGHNAPTGQSAAAILSDQAGGAIVAWQENRSGGPGQGSDIFAQRLSSSGGLQWGPDDVVLCNAISEQTNPRIVSDGAGGAIVTWEDLRNGNYDIFAQRVTADGAPQWIYGSGAPLCQAAGEQSSPAIVSDGAGGAIVTWQDFRGSDHDIYAQRVDAAGVAQWTPDGVALCTATNDQQHPTAASDASGGAIVAWEDHRNGQSDIYTQRVSAGGVPQWAFNGVPLCGAPNDQLEPVMVSDGAGGAIVTWQDLRSFTSWDIYTQDINADGSLGGGVTPTTIALVGARTVPGRVELRWFGSSMAGVAATVYRQTAQAPWTAVASVAGDGTGMLVYEDVDVRPGTSYGYRLSLREGGVEKFYGETWVSVPPLALTLEGLRPNPAVGEPAAAFTLPSGAPARLQLLDVTGRVRLSREVGNLGAGSHLVGLGGSVPAGIYWLRLTQSGRSLLAQGVVVK